MEKADIYYFHRTLVLFDEGFTPTQISKIMGLPTFKIENWIKIREKATAYEQNK